MSLNRARSVLKVRVHGCNLSQ